MLCIQQPELEKLRRLAELAYPNEFCAILVGRQAGAKSSVCSVVACRNEHPEPAHAYSIAPEVLLRVQRESRQNAQDVIGFVHSHPDHPAEPSDSDLRQAYWPGRVYGIISVILGRSSEERFYRFVQEGSATGTFEAMALVISGPE